MQSTLILNASFEPLNIVSGRRAIHLILNGKAAAVDNSPKTFSSLHGEIPIPYVIVLTKMAPHRKRKVGFSRRGVLVRDKFRCTYCPNAATTIDHIIPQSQGGATSYENCVAACFKCNNKKSNKSLKAMGWTVPFAPQPPSPQQIFLHKCKRNSELWNAWLPHIEGRYGVAELV